MSWINIAHPRVSFMMAFGLSVWASTVWAETPSHNVTYETVALTGGTVPGVEAGVTFNTFQAPIINDSGQVAFWSWLAGADVDETNHTTIFLHQSGSSSLMIRDNDPVPGSVTGAVFRGFSNNELAIDSTGQLLVRVSDTENHLGFWLKGDGSLDLIAEKWGIAPDADLGLNIVDLDFPTFNGTGHIAFRSRLAGEGVSLQNDTVVWSGRLGSFRLIAREGSAVPEIGPGVLFSFIGAPMINGAGQAMFWARFTGPNVTQYNNEAIWLDDGHSLRPVVRENDAAPGILGAVFVQLDSSDFNDAGQIALISTVAGRGLNNNNNRGIWSGSPDSLNLIARNGSPAPGAGIGALFTGFERVLLNGSGQIMFLAYVSGRGVDDTNNIGIWSEGTGSLSQVARIGFEAPGTGPGVTFSRFYIPSITFNGAGQTAFMGFLDDNDAVGENDAGIWATDPDGVLTLIVRTGDLFDIDDDPLIEDMRTILSFPMVGGSGGEDGRRTSFDDHGRLAFRLDFTDGTSGIFVSTVPEPTGLAMLGLSGLALVRRRR